MNQFLGIPEFVWSMIFNVAEVLFVGLIIGVFALRYQKRKEYETQLKGERLKMGIRSMEKLSELNCELTREVAPPFYLQKSYRDFIDGTPFPTNSIEYLSVFASPEDFDAYFHSVSEFYRKNKIFVDQRIEHTLDEYLSYLSQLKRLLDAFCDAEHQNALKVSDKAITQHISMAYNLCGIMLLNDFRHFYGYIDRQIVWEMNHLDLSYKNFYFRSKWAKAKGWIFLKLSPYMEDENIRGKAARFVCSKCLNRRMGSSLLVRYGNYIVLVFMKIHYSSKYSIKEMDEWDDETAKRMLGDFVTFFNACYSRA